MNKLAILAVIAALSVTACNKNNNSAAHDKFIEMCKDDPRAKAQGFDCSCQADIISAVLKTDEMDLLVNFLDVEKKDQAKAMEIGKDPKYGPMFQKIAGIGLAIHDKCSNPGKAAPVPAAAPTSAAPAASAAPAVSTAPAPAVKK